MTILFFGDSITQGFWSISGGWVDKLRQHYDAIAIQDLDNSTQPYVFNLGIPGDTTRKLLGRIKNETLARTSNDEPVVVVVAIGTNDDLFEADKQWVGPDEFRTNLEKIVATLEPIAAGMLFVGNPACDETRTTPVSWGDFTYTNRELERSEQTIAEVAASHDLAFVPIFDGFKAKLESGEDLLQDGLHPNEAGHQYMTDLVLPELDALISNLA